MVDATAEYPAPGRKIRNTWCFSLQNNRGRRFYNFLLIAVQILGGAARADEGEVRIIAPSLGRPAFVDNGGTIAVVVTGLSGAIEARLLHPRIEGVSYRLESDAPSAADATAGAFQLRLPEKTPARVYDLEVRANGKIAVARHAVAVGRIGNALRIVHLSDMNIGDVQSPEFDRRLQQEINLISPHVIVGTGDFLDAGHPRLDEGWGKLTDFLCGFDAPIILACGDHDDGERFSRHIAASAIGTVDCGIFQFVVLSDHNLAPIETDAEQIRWVEDTLRTPLAKGARIVVSHASSPTLLRLWQRNGILKERMARASLSAWLGGGGRELAPGELGDLLGAVRPMRFVRTGASSCALVSGGDGIPRYRVLFVSSSNENTGAPAAKAGEDRAWAAGRLSFRQESSNANDARVCVSAVNNNDFAISDACCFVRLAKSSGERPWVRGAELVHAADLGVEWECRLKFDLPAKSTVRAIAGADAPLPEVSVEVKFDVPSRVQSAAKMGEDGLLYWTASGASGTIALQNRGATAVECSPLVRWDGEVVAWKAADQVEEFVASARLTLAAGAVQRLQLDLSAARVVPGSRSLVCYVNDGWTLTPTPQRIEVVQERGATK